MSAAVLLNGSDIVVSEAAVSAMLLVMAGPAGFSPNRILEATIGGAVALLIVIVFPPNPIVPVGRAGQAVFAQLGQALERVAAAITANDADRADAALAQARAIDALLHKLDDALATSVETVRTAPTRFGAREPVERYARSFEQIDLAVRNTRVLARHAHRALRSGQHARPPRRSPTWPRPSGSSPPPTTTRSAPRTPATLASRAAAAAPHDALGESVRSTAVDLMRAAELVAGAPDELPTEELLLGLATRDELPAS